MTGGRRVPGVLAVMVGVAVGLLPACGGDDSAKVARELRRQNAGADMKVLLPKDGIKGNTVELSLSGAGVDIVEPNGDTSGKTGHYVVFVDKDPVAAGAKIPGDRDVIETAEKTATVTGLTMGSHTVTVVLADGKHRRIGTVPAETTFTITGPTLRATAPLTVKAKAPVSISVQSEGVSLVPADGSTEATTGHVDVFIDRDPLSGATKVPTERGIQHTSASPITVTDLSSGEHHIWLVLSKGDETQFDPLVADMVTVTVG